MLWVIHVKGCIVVGPPPCGALRRVDSDSGLELKLDVDVLAADSPWNGVRAQHRIGLENDCCSDARAWYGGVGTARGPVVRRDLEEQMVVVVSCPFETRTMAWSDCWS